MKVQVRPNRPIYPTPAALITCADEKGSIRVDKLDGFAFVLGEFWTLGRKMKRS